MTKQSRKIYVVGPQKSYMVWMGGVLTDTIAAADLVVFTGGEDVCPEVYGDKVHPLTQFNVTRDNFEINEFNKAREMKKKMVGICRGAQFLCVMAGGQLVQHQDNPKHMHRITTFDEESILVTSTHHQAQYPWLLADEDFRVLGWTVGISPFHEDGDKDELVNNVVPGNIEVENCYYPHIRALCIQGHPEMIYHRPGWRHDKECAKSIAYHSHLLDLFINEFPNAK